MIKMPAVFRTHMVLQRNKRIAVWGKTDAQEVSMILKKEIASGEGNPMQGKAADGAHSLCVKTASDGSFFAFLPPLQAGGPYMLTIAAGADEVTYTDIMIGEVWLAGGQSNMELELQNSKNGREIVSDIHDAGVRFYYTPKVPWVGEELFEAEEKSCWELCEPQTAGKWSAVGYYFAQKLSRELGVTVGVIGCNWGGTSASCWVGREALENDRSISCYIEEYDDIVRHQDPEEYLRDRAAYIAFQTEFDKNVGLYYATAENPTWEEAQMLYGKNQYPGPMGPHTEQRPCGLYESMLMRICPYTLGGFLFYQGEEDDHRPYSYYNLLTALIRQWRRDWKDDSLPFLLVQLPMFQNGGGEPDFGNWPFIREAQMRVFRTFKNTGIAVILDKGEFANIHPTEKDTVGFRLADQALCYVYGRLPEEAVHGPIYRDYYVDGEKMVLSFDHAADGFTCTEAQIFGFELAGEDKVYHPATAACQGAQIVLQCSDVDRPVYARFQWTNYRPVTLFGKNGLPVAPFRTSMEDGAIALGSRNTGLFESEAVK